MYDEGINTDISLLDCLATWDASEGKRSNGI